MSAPLSPITLEWFERRFGKPTAVQKGTWDAVLAGHHVLAVAPTGSGKTMAAFLVALDALFTGKLTSGALSVLYISPLKALGTDIKENLTGPLLELQAAHRSVQSASDTVPQITIGIRNGDTSPAERRRQMVKPPDILVTTPESLNILLLSDGGRNALATARICIVDEVHAIATNHRGTLLSCALERLCDLAGDVQRIGLTATVRPVDRAAAFLGGYQQAAVDSPAVGDFIPRSVTIVAPPSAKKVHISVEPLPAAHIGEKPDPDGFWREIAGRLREVIVERRSTLAFIDSRKWSEKMAQLINEGREEPFAWAHHGSLSKDMRRLVEKRLKDGGLRAVVATGSLELGIDVGSLDEVVMLGSPSTPSTALQRAGRAGHRPGETSHARIYPIHPADMMAATVLSKLAREGRIEELYIPENPLDVLAQVLLALCAEKGRSESELWDIIRRSWSYRNLPRPSFDAVLGMLRGRYAETRIQALKPRLYKDGEVLIARPGTRLHLYSGGGAIPDLGMYAVRQKGVDGSLGSLDEKFVWESQLGSVFHLGNRRWRIVGVDDKNVTVIPTDEDVTTEPFWRAEGRNRDVDYALAIADLLGEAEALLAGSGGRGALADHLSESWDMGDQQADSLIGYLENQRRRTGASLPHRGLIVAEAAADPETGSEPGSRTLFLHTFRGGRVNRPLALALQGAWSQRSSIPLVPTVTDESVAFTLTDSEVEEFVRTLWTLSDTRSLIRGVLESTPFFGGRFREAAGRAMLLPSSTPRKRQPLWMTRQRSRALLEAVSSYPDFPIMAEVWRACMRDEFAMDALDDLLADIRGGAVRVEIVRTPAPSPFAGSAVRRRVARRMTANMRDQSDARLTSRLDSSEIRRIVRAGSLRPRIPRDLIERLDARRRRVEPGYAPTTVEALKAWIAEREAFDRRDWEETLIAVAGYEGDTAELADSVASAVEHVPLGPLGHPWMISVERTREWREALEGNSQHLRDPGAAARIIGFWLSGRGPQSISKTLELFGIPPESPSAGELLEILTEENRGTVIRDRIGEDGGEENLCDEEGLEILLRWRRRQSRNTDAPLPAERLAPFLAEVQRLTRPAGGSDAISEALAVLEGLPLPASSWETSVLPVRVSPYRPSDLDSVIAIGEAMWVGTGEQRIAFLTAEGGWRFPAPESESPVMPFPSPGDVPKGFWDIAGELGVESAEATDAIWQRVWTGRLTTDDIPTLRRAVAAGFTAPPAVKNGRRASGGLRGWKAGRPVTGRWYAPAYADEPEDAFETDRCMRERIRLLLGRYGMLCRPLLEREIPTWHWAYLDRTLQLMEMADEVVGGRWFEDLPMPQFLAPEFLPLWCSGATPSGSWCIDAADPASPCGLGAISQLPPRRQGQWLGWDEDGIPLFQLKVGSGALEIPDSSYGHICDGKPGLSDPRRRLSDGLTAVASLLTERSVSPMNKLIIKAINGHDIGTGGAAAVLEEAGYRPLGTGEWVYRPRPIGVGG